MGQNLNKLVFQPPEPSYQKHPNLIWLHNDQGAVLPATYIRAYVWTESGITKMKEVGRHSEYGRPKAGDAVKGLQQPMIENTLKDGMIQEAHFTLLFSHGNAEDLGLIVKFFEKLSIALKVNVFAYEYTGYGMSSGVAEKETDIYCDIEAAFKYLRDVLRVDWKQIVLYGRSIGTGPSCHLATRTAVRGMILQSPMASIYRIVFDFRFTLPGDLFANIDKVSDMSTPVLIIHGTRDEIVPCWHGRDMFGACARQRIAFAAHWVDGADHNTLEDHAGKAFVDYLREFLNYLHDTPISDELQRQAETSSLSTICVHEAPPKGPGEFM